MRLKIGENIFNVKVVQSVNDRAAGMMGKTFNDHYNGMLFLMDEDISCFWMKNCVIPLDIIFIDRGTISKIHHDCPPCESEEDHECENYCGRGRMILEVDGGTCKELEISRGDQVQFLL
jgi:uncharacterized membrane protein (UPF0127 family)